MNISHLKNICYQRLNTKAPVEIWYDDVLAVGSIFP